jgi:glycosyltransferase involved in cell wall biosynthesis
MFFKKKNKILFFLPSFADGGAEEVIISLANQFNKKGVNLSFIVGNKSGNNKIKINKKITLINLKKSRLRKCFGSLVANIRKLKPKVVITTLAHSNLFFCFIKYFYNCNFKLIIRETNISPMGYLPLKNRIKIQAINILKKILYNKADYILAINSQSKKELLALGIKKEKIKIFNNPSIKENFINLANQKIKHKKVINENYILYVGRFATHKKINFLVKIFYDVQKKVNSKLVLIGQGKELNHVRKLVKSLKIEKKVIFIRYEKNPLPYMKNASTFVSFSEYEGQPNSVIQSLGCGTSTLIKSYPGLNKEIEKAQNSKILKKLTNFKIIQTIIQNIKVKKKNNFNKKIIKAFNEEQYASKIIKMIYG